jgi:uncharacterized protein YxjI
MRYVMREKLFSWGDDFTIQDDQGRDVYFVDGKAFSWGKQLSFQDMQGNELLYIKQKVFAWGPTYEITRGDEPVATVTKEIFTLFSCRFTVDVPGPDDLEARGDFMHHEYEFTRHGETVARVSKTWFSFADTYGVEILPGEDDALVLASTVVVDAACHRDGKR